MNLEKHYYDESEQTRVEIKNIVQAEESSFTDSERKLRAEQYRNEIDLIFDKAIAQSKQREKLISKGKVQRFYRLVKKADCLAARLEANFTAHTDKGCKGIIRLSAPQMIVDDSWENGELRILAKLISDASDLWIDTINHNGKTLVQIEFVYDFSGIELE